MIYSNVKILAEYLTVNLRESCLRIEPAGSFRRKKAEVHPCQPVRLRTVKNGRQGCIFAAHQKW